MMDTAPATESSGEPKKSRCAKRLFYAFLCGLLMLVGVYVFLDWSGRNRWEETRARLEKEGLPMKPRKLERPDVPPEENFGESPLMRAAAGLDGAETQRRLELFTDLAHVFRSIDNFRSTSDSFTVEHINEFRTAMAGTGEWLIPSVEQEPEDTKAILAALRELDARCGELIPHAKLPYAFPSHDLGTITTFGVPNSIISACQKVSDSLRLLIYCHLHSGDMQRAVDLITVMPRLAEFTDSAHSLASLVNSKGIHSHSLSSIQGGLDLHKWKESHLRQFAEVFQKQPASQYAEAIRHDWLAFLNYVDDPEFWDTDEKALTQYLPKGVLLEAKSNYAEITQALIRALETGGLPGAIAEADKICRSPNSKSTVPWIRLPYLFAGVHQNALLRSQRVDFDTAALRLQLALELHFLQNGSYPKALPDLVPAKIESIPADLDGKPLRYLLEAPDRYVIWSIGINGVDDWSGDWSKMTLDDLNNSWTAADWLVTLPSLKMRFEQKKNSRAKSLPSAPY
jgi:hypothetical protein